MRAALGVATVLALVFAMAMAALAVVPSGNYLDEFSSESYSGSDGSEDWRNDPWKELGDDANPTTGSVYVDSSGCSGRCLKISSQGKQLNGVGATRHADTSVFSGFDFCYEVSFEGDDELTDAVLVVEKSVDGGEVWYQLAAHKLHDGFWLHPSYGIGQYDSMTIRFVVFGNMVGELFIDDVEIKGERAVSTTTTTKPATTTTTKPATTTTTKPATTTTTKPATTTTAERSGETTTTSHPTTTTSPDRLPSSTTTTTISSTTSTTEAFVVADNDSPGGPLPPPESGGIRETQTGIQADFDSSMFGDIEGGTLSVSTVDHQVDYRMAVELIRSSWVWLVVLAFVVAWSIVSGLERRRSVAGS